MKRLKRVGLLLLSMTLLMSTTVFGATKSGEVLSQIKSKLADAGVPTQFIPNIIEQVVEEEFTKSDADLLAGKIDSLQAQIGTKNKKADFTKDELFNMLKDADDTSNLFGMDLVADNGKNNTITVYDRHKVALTTLTPAGLRDLYKGIDTVKLKEALYLAVDYAKALEEDFNSDSENSNGKVTDNTTSSSVTGTTTDSIQKLPNLIMATALKQTGTNNGNLLVVGFGLMALAGVVFVGARKRVLA